MAEWDFQEKIKPLEAQMHFEKKAVLEIYLNLLKSYLGKDLTIEFQDMYLLKDIDGKIISCLSDNIDNAIRQLMGMIDGICLMKRNPELCSQ